MNSRIFNFSSFFFRIHPRNGYTAESSWKKTLPGCCLKSGSFSPASVGGRCFLWSKWTKPDRKGYNNRWCERPGGQLLASATLSSSLSLADAQLLHHHNNRSLAGHTAASFLLAKEKKDFGVFYVKVSVPVKVLAPFFSPTFRVVVAGKGCLSLI